MKRAIKYISAAAGILLSGFVSCEEKQPDNRPGEPLSVSRTDIVVAGDREAFLGIMSRSGDWNITGTTDWCAVTPSSGGTGVTEVVITFGERTQDVRETTLVITAGETTKEVRVRQLAAGQEIEIPGQDPETNVNKQVHELVLNEYYLWNEETKTALADYSQPYDEFLRTFLSSLKTNGMDGGTTSGNVRYIYSYIKRYPQGQTRSEARAVPTYGMEFQFVTGFNKPVCRILYVDPGGAAANAGLKRGSWFNRINGTALTATNYEELLRPLFDPVAGMQVALGTANYQSSTGTIVDESGSVTVTANTYAASPILYSGVMARRDAEGTEFNVGYLAYSRFDAAFNSDLINVMDRFRNEGVSQLILDLRYNRGGAVETAELMANLIAPQSAAGKTFAKYGFNEEIGALYNRTAAFTPATGSLNLNKIYVFSTGMTASASELVINGFNGIEDVKVIMIGTKTEGKNVGMVKYPGEIRSELNGVRYEYDVWPVAFKCSNAKDLSNYHKGLTPNGEIIDEWKTDYIKWKAFGSQEEPMLLKALQYIEGKLQEPQEDILIDGTRADTGSENFVRLAPGMMTMQIK